MDAKQGTFSIEAIPVATLPIPGWEAFFGMNDNNWYDLTFYVWLLYDGRYRGLVDLGPPDDAADFDALRSACQSVDARSTLRRECSLTDALERFGVVPADIDFVLLTQSITYHSGGLAREWLPNAEVFLAADGLREMLIQPPGHPPVDAYFTPSSWVFLRELAVQGRLHLVRQATEVVPGVQFEPTGGHHPGSAGVRIATHFGTVGLLETAFFQRNIDEVLPIGIAENAAQARAIIKRYRTECEDVVAIHDPGNTIRFKPQPR